MNCLRTLAMLSLLGWLAVAIGWSSSVRTTSALVKDAEGSSLTLPQASPTCVPLPPPSCTPNTIGGNDCNTRSTSSMQILNPCTGELITFQVDTHLRVHTHTDASGGLHSTYHLQMHGQGSPQAMSAVTNGDFTFIKAGASAIGEEYTFSAMKDGSSYNGGPPPETFSDPISFLVISRGKSQNFMMHMVFHMTISNNGMTAETCQEKTSCQGKAPPTS